LNLNQNTNKLYKKAKQRVEQSFHNRMEYYMKLAKDKKEKLKTERIKQSLKECNFAPLINITNEKRLLRDFLNDQEKFLNNKQAHINELKEMKKSREESEPIGQPKINNNFKKLGEISKQKLNETVYDRLYPKTANTKENPQENNKLDSNKTSHVGLNRSLILYHDAEKRYKKIEKARKDIKMPKKILKNSLSEEMLTQKFRKDYTRNLDILGIKEGKIDKLQMSIT